MGEGRRWAPAQVDSHDHFLEGRVSSAFPYSVDGTLDLARTRHGASQAVRGAQPQVVLAVGGEDDVPGARGIFPQILDEAAELVRQIPARRVRDVQRGGARLDHLFQHTVEEAWLRPAHGA